MAIKVRDDHLAISREIEEAVRKRPPGQTAHAARARKLAQYERWIIDNCAAIAAFVMEQERMKGAGTMLRQKKGEATEHDVQLYIWRFNVAKEIKEAIERIVPVRSVVLGSEEQATK